MDFDCFIQTISMEQFPLDCSLPPNLHKLPGVNWEHGTRWRIKLTTGGRNKKNRRKK